MENDESQTQQNEWQQGLEPRTDVPIAPAPKLGDVIAEPARPLKNPDDTPTGELVADYEALLADIKVRKANQDDALKALDQMRVETVTAYETAVKGATVEAAKLLVVISKRLGMPLNGAQPVVSQSVSQDRRLTAQGAARVPYGSVACEVCGKVMLANGLGMHMMAHERRGETAKNYTASVKTQTRWCEQCGEAIHAKGWTQHQAAHQRHGKVLPRKIDHAERVFGQSMSDAKCREMLAALSKLQPISSRGYQDRTGKTNQSAFFTGLKERGYAINKNALWSVTPKGAAFLHMQS